MGYKYEVFVQGKWHTNQVVFATKEEAEQAGKNKFMSWTMCDEYRVVESDQLVNYRWTAEDGIIHIATND